MISTSTSSDGISVALSGIMSLCNVRLVGVAQPTEVRGVKVLNK